MQSIPVVHNPRNLRCPKNYDPSASCLCTSREARGWIPAEGIDEQPEEEDNKE